MKWSACRKKIIPVVDQQEFLRLRYVELISSIVNRRVELKITQRQLAEKTGIQQAVIARIENLIVRPRIDTLFRIFCALNMEFKVDLDFENFKP